MNKGAINFFFFQCKKIPTTVCFKFLFYCWSENAESEPAKPKIPIAETTDKCDNIFMITGDDYLDNLEKNLSR